MVFDKTGTLTKGKPTITSFQHYGRLSRHETLALVAAAEENSEHPLAGALLDFAKHATQVGPKSPASEPGVKDTAWVREAEDFEAVPGGGVRCRVGGLEVVVGNRRLIEEGGVKISEEVAHHIQQVRDMEGGQPWLKERAGGGIVVDSNVEGLEVATSCTLLFFVC